MNGFVKASRSTVWKSQVHLGERVGVVDAGLHPLEELAEAREHPVGEPPRLRLEKRRLDEESQRVDLLARAQRRGGDDNALVGGRDDRPSPSSRLSALRSGVRPTPSASISPVWASRWPGAYAPSTIRSRRRT